MKKLLIATFLLSAFFSIGQEENQTKVSSLSDSMSPEEVSSRQTPNASVPEGTALINQQVNGSNYQYRFISNRIFDETIKERWEYRFPISFPYIVEFSMNISTQEILITLPQDHTEEELLKLVKRFNYINYQIQ